MEKTLKIMNTNNTAKTSLTKPHPKCHNYVSLKYLQGLGNDNFFYRFVIFHNLPWQPPPMLDDPFGEEIFLNVKPKLPLV